MKTTQESTKKLYSDLFDSKNLEWVEKPGFDRGTIHLYVGSSNSKIKATIQIKKNGKHNTCINIFDSKEYRKNKNVIKELGMKDVSIKSDVHKNSMRFKFMNGKSEQRPHYDDNLSELKKLINAGLIK